MEGRPDDPVPMSEQTDDDLREEFTDALDSAAAALSDDGDLSEGEAADLRARVEQLANDVSAASVPHLLAAAGVDDGGDAEDDDGSGDEGEVSLTEALADADSTGVDSLRQLLDVAELGEDAPEDDREFTERLAAIVDADEIEGESEADDDGKVDDGGEADEGSEAGETDGAGGGGDTGDHDGSSDGDDDLVTFADVFSGAASLAKDWSDSRSQAAEDESSMDETDEEETPDADGEGEESEEEDEDGLFDPEDIKKRLSGDDEEESSGGRQSRRGRYSTVPSRRSDMGKSRRFSTVKGRK